MSSRKREQARAESLIEWVKRPLPPVYDPDASRCSATNFFTWGLWYAAQVTDGLSEQIRLAIAAYLDEEMSVDHMIFCVETGTSPYEHTDEWRDYISRPRPLDSPASI